MDIKQLEELMIAHGVALRAIPKRDVAVYEKEHAARFPGGTICFLRSYGREMLVVEKVPVNAGKFIFEYAGTSNVVTFPGKQYFDSIEEAATALAEADSRKKVRYRLECEGNEKPLYFCVATDVTRFIEEATGAYIPAMFIDDACLNRKSGYRSMLKNSGITVEIV